ncbi:MAG: hypothetical protein ACPGSE_08250 [Synechococcus sp.]
METVAFHVLSRLAPRQLEMLTGGAQDRDTELLAAVKLRDLADGALAQAITEHDNAKQGLATAIGKGWDLEVFQETVAATKAKAEQAKGDQAKAAAEVSLLQSDRHAGSMSGPVADLRAAVLAGTDTPEQRRAVNKGLRDLGVQILLDTGRVGIRLGDGPAIWQPLGSMESERAALAKGYTDSTRTKAGEVLITTAPAQSESQPLQIA